MSTLRQEALEAQKHALALVSFFDRLIAATEPKPVSVPPSVSTAGLQSPEAFYEYVSGDAGELFPTMSQAQVDGCDRLLTAAEGKLPLGWCAYLLATAFHETARTMQPVREAFWVSENWRKKNLRYYPWYGRGDVQLTWERNYKVAGDYIGVDLISDPDRAMIPENSSRIAVGGMLEGWFTGKKLRDYLPAQPTREHYKNARRIINGTDKADLIAGYAIEFEKGLKLGDWR